MSQRAQQEVVRGTSEGEGMTPKEAEAYTRARWIEVREVYPSPRDDGEIYIGGKYLFDTWLAAAELTLQHEEEIRQKREEIDLLKAEESLWPNYFAEHPAFARILAVLESQLAALLVGWKETP